MTQKNCEEENEDMPFLKYSTEQDFPLVTKNVLLELQQLIGPFEYRAVNDRWCIRTIPDATDKEQPLAVLGKTMDAAARRMMAVVRLMD